MISRSLVIHICKWRTDLSIESELHNDWLSSYGYFYTRIVLIPGKCKSAQNVLQWTTFFIWKLFTCELFTEWNQLRMYAEVSLNTFIVYRDIIVLVLFKERSICRDGNNTCTLLKNPLGPWKVLLGNLPSLRSVEQVVKAQLQTIALAPYKGSFPSGLCAQ